MENIFIDQGQVFLGDFGLSIKALDNWYAKTRAIGQKQFLPPEVHNEFASMKYKETDIFDFGNKSEDS